MILETVRKAILAARLTADQQRAVGARPDRDGTRFRVWAPAARRVTVEVVPTDRDPIRVPLVPEADGYFAGHVPGIHPGDRYRYHLDDRDGLPDPASRYQPEGVHGPSEVIDPTAFAWTDNGWEGVEPEDLVIYELHVGTFSPAGTFDGVRERLSYLADLGVTAIELMPVADFPGDRGWGYDGVSPFAPARCYGRPDDLRRLVDQAHRVGLAVILDVVYNHLGPDGNYLGAYSPHYFTDRHKTPWGAAVNFDGEHSRPVRDFFIQNAVHWVREYHLDGLRLDATHAIIDHSPRHFLAELTDTVREAVPDRRILLIAEDHRNLAQMARPAAAGGWGLDAVWADGFHHQLRRLLAGDSEGYFGDYTGTPRDLAATVRQGWFYTGQFSAHLGEARGTDPTGLPPRAFVHCLQNHDQIGNRALGDRLNQAIDPAAFRAATALLLCSPATPLLFQGQEWAAGTPFCYFTDHNEELGRLVTAGRREEFKYFRAFADPAARDAIPDPQSLATFEQSKLNWDELGREPHAGVLRLHQALVRLRRTDPALRRNDRTGFTIGGAGANTVLMRYDGRRGAELLVVAYFGTGSRTVPIGPADGPAAWEPVLTTEDPAFCTDPRPIRADQSGPATLVSFDRPGTIVLARG